MCFSKLFLGRGEVKQLLEQGNKQELKKSKIKLH